MADTVKFSKFEALSFRYMVAWQYVWATDMNINKQEKMFQIVRTNLF